ncbi:MAG TPA: MATE family efflux transporter [Candidatus Thermoplasmatota archaeon]|nr:MATE family efflux transporter [Candidatus Thermoplasmatota archaeon]
MTSAPRLPVGGQTSTSFQAVWRRVARPDLPRSRRVLAVAWPVVVTNFLQTLALTVDLVFVGTLGTLALAATGVATQVFFVGMVVGNGLAAGATALVARAIGAGDREAADRATTAAVVLALLVSAPLALATYFLDAPLLRLMGADPAVVEQGSLVLRVLALGIPGNLVILAASGALQGAGDTRPALVVGIGVNVVNLALDWVLIFGKLGAPEMGLAGAAVATAVSYTVGGLAFLVLLARRRRPVGLARRAGGLGDAPRRLARVGAPATLEQLVLSLGFTAYLILILDFGADALAAHQIGLRVQSFAFMPGFGFAAAAAALVGQDLGRGDPEAAETSGWTAIAMGLAVMVGMGILMFLLASPIAALFTDDPEAIGLGVTWIHALVFAMPAIAFHFTAAGALRGAGDTRWPLLVSFAGLWLVRLPVAWVLGVALGFGMYGVWAGYMIEYYARALVTTWRFARGRWKTLDV